MTAATGTRPGRHRSASADAAILAATLDVLRERGYAGLTVAAVIERARVSSATLYRRWPTKHDLVAAAIASLGSEDVEIDTGDLRADVAELVRHVARSLTARGSIVELLGAGADADPQLGAALRAKLLLPRTRALEAILGRARARGELPSSPPVDTVLALLVGPLHYRLTALGKPLGPAFLRSVTASVVRSLVPGPDPSEPATN
jgi:AcrR family transcriptional regulator